MSTARPTSFEFEILQELWDRGPLTVREVYETLNSRRSLVYTTVLKALQVMHEKGYVTRDDSQRSHVFVAAIGETEAKRNSVQALADTVFGGSAAELAMHALSSKPASSDEIAKIEQLLDTLKRESREGSPKQ